MATAAIGVAGQFVNMAFQIGARRQARRAAEQKASAERTSQYLDAARQRMISIREARAKRAAILQSAENQGAAGSSGAAGGAAGILGQLEQNLTFINQQFDLGHEMLNASAQMQLANRNANIGKMVADSSAALAKSGL